MSVQEEGTDIRAACPLQPLTARLGCTGAPLWGRVAFVGGKHGTG